MKQKYFALPSLVLGFLILGVSIYKTASVKYVFSQAPSPTPITQKPLNINYHLPEPDITPGHVFWPVQAVIDKADTTAESYLENADIRLVAGKQMVEKGKVEEGYVVLEKAALYLEKSYEAAIETEMGSESEMLYQISLASLKHREVLETILSIAPDDARAVVTKILDTPKSVYEKTSGDLQGAGLTPPSYPF